MRCPYHKHRKNKIRMSAKNLLFSHAHSNFKRIYCGLFWLNLRVYG